MEDHVTEALQMLEAFTNVGVKRFNVTLTDLQQNKVAYWPGRNVGAMKLLLPYAVTWSWERHQNLILRPQSIGGGVLAQLDDLGAQELDWARSRAFLTLETSPGNYQAWLFVEGGTDELVRRMVRGMDVDWKASRAVRMAGTLNCKPKYAPDFPIVRIQGFGGDARLEDLKKRLPFAVAASVVPDAKNLQVRKPASRRVWPSYQMCLDRAPESSSGGKQRVMADFTWCCIAVDWGWTVDEIAAKLMEVSTKAQENGEEYARKTAEAAAKKVAMNPRRGKQEIS